MCRQGPPTVPRPFKRAHHHPMAVLGLLAGSWIVLCGAVVGFGWLLVHPLAGSVGEVDDDVARVVAGHRTPMLTDIAVAGAFIGETWVGATGLVVVALGFSLWWRSAAPGLFVAAVGAGLAGIYLATTSLISRPRPPVQLLDHGLVPDHSFPSGHVATATALCGTVVVLAWVVGSPARWWVTPLLLLPVGAATARLYQGAHHLSDVLTSLSYTTVWLGVAATVLLGSRSAPP